MCLSLSSSRCLKCKNSAKIKMPELNGLKNLIASPQKKFFIPFMF